MPTPTYTMAVVVKDPTPGQNRYVLKMVADARCGTPAKLVDGDLGVGPLGMLVWRYAATGADRQLKFSGDLLTEFGTPECVELPGPGGGNGERMYVLVAKPTHPPPIGTTRIVAYQLHVAKKASPDPADPSDWELVHFLDDEPEAVAKTTGEIKMPPS